MTLMVMRGCTSTSRIELEPGVGMDHLVRRLEGVLAPGMEV